MEDEKMDYLIKVNAYVKQENFIYLRNIKPEDIEEKSKNSSI